MDHRARIIDVTARLLADSPTGEVSTRAVAEAAGVQQPTLYRLFGDKDGLIAATIAAAFEAYLGGKRAAEPGPDPVADIRAGWDRHTEFALAHPALYRLTLRGGTDTPDGALAEAYALLHALVLRADALGRLRIDPEHATRTIMAANTGIALALVTRPEVHPDPAISAIVRDVTLAGVCTDAPLPGSDPVIAAASTLASALTAGPAEAAETGTSETAARFTPAERALLGEWLGRLGA
ncbi:TetR/AcrR family transcriptional regulator [Mycetocola tolaasinivorans]|uniref:TetR/AcrR family transcriptional regulator n=1 Tax=Mycetocola tolaasinivorans TaxID=76635 RepID=A0A3L7A6B1_9MICO|nr:TetR/AcrR family transcriptional regulator [Mycetocola tolaasinivorans]RLP75605.1 TetR/AcrR family transcriptional regulator [Mycetocola tolaasinivorans]